MLRPLEWVECNEAYVGKGVELDTRAQHTVHCHGARRER